MRFIGLGEDAMIDVNDDLPPTWLVVPSDARDFVAHVEMPATDLRVAIFRRETRVFQPAQKTPDQIVYRFDGWRA